MKALQTLFLLVVIAGASYGVWTYGKPLLYPCSEPLTYSVRVYDPRFGLSEAEFADALEDAAELLNEAAGRSVLAASDDGALAIELVYSQEQQTAELGEDIDSQQASYEAKRSAVEQMRARYLQEERAYEAQSARYEKRAQAYGASVSYWNERGGAPEQEYAKLQEERRSLEREEAELAEGAQNINALADELNAQVEELNALAKKLNAKVSAYNQQAGEAFDQGRYVQDSQGRRIEIFEFTDGTELRRVLVHEFGHALGMDHVENPQSIMYAFNIGTELSLTPEDIAELRSSCRLE